MRHTAAELQAMPPPDRKRFLVREGTDEITGMAESLPMGAGLVNVGKAAGRLLKVAVRPGAGEVPYYVNKTNPATGYTFEGIGNPFDQAPDATHIRLYRGINPAPWRNASMEADDAQSLGTWFTDTPEAARHWAKGGEVVSVDVPVEIARPAMRGEVSGVPGNVFNLKPEWQRRAK
jgi:hypothetical protein